MVINMKRKLFLRSIFGFPVGVTIGYFITIVISLIMADGQYFPCEPALVALIGSEINAVLLQAILCGLLGAGFSAASIIWDIENWGIIKQTAIYFLVISAIMMPIAYVMYWMEHSMKGILGYFTIFVFIFAVIWIIEYCIIRHNVRKMNETLSKKRCGGGKKKQNKNDIEKIM